jgi:DnaJ domain
MALGSDPYAVLGVPRDASDDQIARARRRLSREYHPDVNPAPDAAARFAEVQRAYDQLSAARPEYDRTHDERGRTRVARDPGGGYGSATEASPGLFIQPTSVDFGRLTPTRPRANAKVTVAWTGPPPARLESTPGSGWWANLGAEQPATSCVVFYLRAHAHAGTPNGRQQAQFTVIFDDTTLTVQLRAEIFGEFPPGSQPDFTPRPQPGTGGRLSALPAELQAWVVTVLALVILLLVIVIRG